MDWAISEMLSQARSSVRETCGINEYFEKLRLTLPKVNTLMDEVEWWRFVNPNVAKLFTELKDAKYDAEDLFDEFDYQELKEKVKEGEGSSQASQVINRATNFVWGVASSFVKGFVSGNSNDIKDIQERLELISENLRQTTELLEPKRPELIKRMSARRKTSSIVIESKLFGRDREKETVINIFSQLGDGSSSSSREHHCNKRRKNESLSVLPVVGMGGLGKTTLAQMVYNDSRVDGYFELKLWVCVREHFDEKKIIKMIVKSATKMKVEFTYMNLLQVVLKNEVLSKKFLLVLDDVWCEDRLEWQKLYSRMSNGIKGSMILVTTRSPKVAKITGTENPIFLEGLPKEHFWDFFKRCAFDPEDPENYPDLVNVAEKNVTKLKGSPLAAKTLGALLSTDLDCEHWRIIMNSEMWQFNQGENGITSALRLSYQYLTAELKRCFSFCCMFPKEYLFDKSRTVAKWVAHGYIVPQGDEILEERGAKCFDELVSRSFLQAGSCNGMYVMHDLMHDLAQFVSMDECFYIQACESQQKKPGSIRHLSIARNFIEGTKLGKYSKLWSLEFLSPANQCSYELQSSIDSLFSQLTHLRMLDLRCCEINELPERLGNMKHLRYLDLSHNKLEVLPESIEQLLNLQYLDISVNNLKGFPKGFTNLISLRKLYWDRYDIPVISGIGKLTSLQNLLLYQARRIDGQTIGELKDMTQLYGELLLYHLEEVAGKEEAARAMLINKRYLCDLELKWSCDRNVDQYTDAEVLEGLQPHPNLKLLHINYYGGSKSPSWLQAQFLPYLSKLCIKDCVNLNTVTDLPPSLTNLRIENCPCFTSLTGNAFYRLKVLQELYIQECENLEVIGGLFNPLSLKNLSIIRCPKLMKLEIFIPESEGKGSCRSRLEVLAVSDTSLLKLPSLRGALDSLLTLEIVWPELIKMMSATRKTSSIVIESEIFGRDIEKETVINIFSQLGDGSSSSSREHHGNKKRKKESLSVLPVVGMGGLGKTTLAQMVYNDSRVEGYFELKLWVCVGEHFDEKKIIEMIVKSATKMMVEFTNLNSLHLVLKDEVLSKKFLLVLDDVWCEDRLEWQKLYSRMSNGVKGSMILVTTHSPKVAKITGTENPIFLEGLPKEPFWDFFKRCAFGSEDPENYPDLVNIAEKNVTKLKGSPLAAKTLGALLSTDLDCEHWRIIMNSEMWQFNHGENGIMPALRLSCLIKGKMASCSSVCIRLRT